MPIVGPTVQNSVYCLRVADVCKTANADIVSFDFGIILYTENVPTNAEKIDKKYPFLLKQTMEAVENGIGVYPYGAIVQKTPDTLPATGVKLHIVPTGDITHLPEFLMEYFEYFGYLETSEEIAPSGCSVGDIYTISDGT